MNFPAKRFDYSTSPTSEQLPTFNSKYSFNKPNREQREQNMSEMSPINGRAQMNTSFDNKVKLTAPISSGTKYVPRGGYRAEGGEYQIREYAGRGNQENVCFQNVSLQSEEDKLINKALNRENKSRSTYDGTSNYKQRRYSRHEDLLSMTSYDKIPNQTIKIKPGHLQQNINNSTMKMDPSRTTQPHQKRQISERQLIQKIGRINSLNSEINNRLQKMLSKIDSF